MMPENFAHLSRQFEDSNPGALVLVHGKDEAHGYQIALWQCTGRFVLKVADCDVANENLIHDLVLSDSGENSVHCLRTLFPSLIVDVRSGHHPIRIVGNGGAILTDAWVTRTDTPSPRRYSPILPSP
jgi:hypothetical protein